MPQDEESKAQDVVLKKKIFELMTNIQDTLVAKTLYIKESVQILDQERKMQVEFDSSMRDTLQLVGFSNQEYIKAIQQKIIQLNQSEDQLKLKHVNALSNCESVLRQGLVELTKVYQPVEESGAP